MEKNTDQYYTQLIQKYLANKCSFPETEDLFNYLSKDQSGRLLLQNLKSEFEAVHKQSHSIPEEVSERIWSKLEAHVKPVTVPVVPFYQRRIWRNGVAAAIALVMITTGIYIFFTKTPSSPTIATTKPNKVKPYKNDVAAGSNKAVLTLANGSRITLDDQKNGVLATQGNTAVSKTSDGQLIYNSQSTKPETYNIQLNTITTPRGGEYQVILPDGSKVWLNAESSLRFPTAFVGNERNVELTGEAYFEIAKNKNMPFKVSVNDIKITVLGTHFNVMSYKEEVYTATTVLEGSVKVSNNSKEVLLKPGQQAVQNKSSENINVKSVDIDEIVAWKNGYFLFNNENIQSIMRKISRWYDVEVDYEDSMENKEFAGMVSRFKNVSEVLKMLELTGDVHFKLDKRRITVMP